MENSRYPRVYPHSHDEADRLGELNRWEASFHANIACKGAIEQALWQSHSSSAAVSVLEVYGFERVLAVLDQTAQLREDDAFSAEEKEWLRSVSAIRYGKPEAACAVEADANSLAFLTAAVHERYTSLGLFSFEHCEADSKDLDYAGKVLVLSPHILKEAYWTPQSQLWYAQSGFGCDPDSRGRAVFCTCLADGEQTRWERQEFIGVLREEFLPDWAAEKLACLRNRRELKYEPEKTMTMNLM